MHLLNERNIAGYLAEEVRRYDVPVIQNIMTAIHESNCLVAILSHNGRLSPSINQEIGYAVSF
jgi:2-phosphoglycerate kinase